MRAGLQPIVEVLRRRGSPEFIEGSRLGCGCRIPFGRTVAQRQRAEARFRACPKHPGDGARATARRVARTPRVRRTPPPPPAPPPASESFEEDLRRRQEQETLSRRRDRDRNLAQATAQEGEGLASVVAAALQAALHPCGSPQHEQALAQIERGLKLAGRIR